jgi:magnesium transporter
MWDTILTGSIPEKELWVDLQDPSSDELELVALRYKLPLQYIKDCLDPSQLPKCEKFNGMTLICARSFDELSTHQNDTVQGMTRKLIIILGDRFLITIHRKKLSYLDDIFFKYRTAPGEIYLQVIVLEMLLAAVETYHFPLETAEVDIHRYERSLFKSVADEKEWENIFTTKTRLNVIRRMLWHTSNAIQKFFPYSEANRLMTQDLNERIVGLLFFTDGHMENLNNLLNIEISLSAHQTNRIMRILTLFSAVFMPLTFIVGIYGMNFKNMPEIDFKYGYLSTWILILLTAGGIVFWFKTKKWI